MLLVVSAFTISVTSSTALIAARTKKSPVPGVPAPVGSVRGCVVTNPCWWGMWRRGAAEGGSSGDIPSHFQVLTFQAALDFLLLCTGHMCHTLRPHFYLRLPCFVSEQTVLCFVVAKGGHMTGLGAWSNVQIIAACEDIKPGGGYRPKLTFVVVQKRHHTRLFPLNAQLGDRSGNIMPGMPCVHSAIVLASHAPMLSSVDQCLLIITFQ